MLQILSHEAATSAVAYDPDGASIVTGSDDGALRLWDAASGELRATLTGHEGGIRSVGFSPDGRNIISSANDGTVRIWDVAEAESLASAGGR